MKYGRKERGHYKGKNLKQGLTGANTSHANSKYI